MVLFIKSIIIITDEETRETRINQEKKKKSTNLAMRNHAEAVKWVCKDVNYGKCRYYGSTVNLERKAYF